MYKKYNIKGLHCGDCAKKIESYLNDNEHVTHCSLSLEKKTLFIDTKLSVKDIEKLISEIESGIELSDIKKHRQTSTSSKHTHHHDETCTCGHHHHHEGCGCGHDHHHEHSHEVQEERTLNHAISFSIHGLDCPNCAMKVEKVIKGLDYVEDAVLNFSTETLLVKSKEDDLLNKLQDVINGIERGVVLSLKKDNTISKPKLFNLKTQFNIIIGIIFLILGLFVHQIFIIIAYFLIGYPVLWKAFKNITKGDIFDENFLMCIATIGAFIIGEYVEAVAVMLFYSIGEIFQGYAVQKTRFSISSLMNLKTKEVNILVNNKIVVKNVEDIRIGETAVVKVGEKVPVDGTVIYGTSSLDTSSLTGESLPLNVQDGSQVLSGMINLSQVIHVRIDTLYKDSTVKKIIDMIENASSTKAPIETFITRFAKIYTPIVVIGAILLTIIPIVFVKDVNVTDWIYRSLTFLVVSCPCALVISIPLGLYAGLGKASQLGALIKGGNILEYLKHIDTVVFDKTGTLTKGNFKVLEIKGYKDMLKYAAIMESMSHHPIAKCIVQYYNQPVDCNLVRDYKEIAGKGIECFIDQDYYCLGHAGYLKEKNIEFTPYDTYGSVVYVAKNNEYLGYIVVGDEIKESAIKSVSMLKQEGIRKTVMLTGDKKQTAEYVRNEVGVDEVYSELLPGDKVEQLKLLLQEHKVIFAGDGINDAPVLSHAHIGIAMGGAGSDLAIEAADIVLMNDNIESIAQVISLSKRVNKILMQNVVFTLFIKISVLILTMFGYSNMWMGIFADVGVTLIAILNSMRILK